jgi:hypothetical protein
MRLIAFCVHLATCARFRARTQPNLAMPTAHDCCQQAKADGGPLDIITVHYPGFGFAYDSNATHPTTFGEYAHLNCYNRRELLADPGVRENWALGVWEVWERVWHSNAVTGACYWAGIDDLFYMPPINGTRHVVGYGPWGVIDVSIRLAPFYLARSITRVTRARRAHTVVQYCRAEPCSRWNASFVSLRALTLPRLDPPPPHTHTHTHTHTCVSACRGGGAPSQRLTPS